MWLLRPRERKRSGLEQLLSRTAVRAGEAYEALAARVAAALPRWVASGGADAAERAAAPALRAQSGAALQGAAGSERPW